MSALLLAPYNDSMRLGQGYNSFLQTPCIHNAVQFDKKRLITEKSKHGVSQVVSYTSRFVDKISDIVRSMNISAGSSVKSGYITASGSSLTIDEQKFSSSDLNAVVSIKVVNQTTKLQDDAVFKPNKDPSVILDSTKFHEIYGDCFISGFIEGGDLHGIISIKILDASRKEEIKTKLKGIINNGAENSSFKLGGSNTPSTLSASLSQTETTISVNWSGGGQIKPEGDEWSLDTLFDVAAAFPGRVAECPQKTWAILTKYTNNRDFLRYSLSKNIKVLDYSQVRPYASDLLDMYMEYKNNLATIQRVLSEPENYAVSPVNNPVNVSVKALVEERKLMKKQMMQIVWEIDELNKSPELLPEVEAKSNIESPEVWATRLPIRKQIASDSGIILLKDPAAISRLKKLPFAERFQSTKALDAKQSLKVKTKPDSARPDLAGVAGKIFERQQLLPLTSSVLPTTEVIRIPESYLKILSREEIAFLVSSENTRRFSTYWFGPAQGNAKAGVQFFDCVYLENSEAQGKWPTSLKIHMIPYPTATVIGLCETIYGSVSIIHGRKAALVSTIQGWKAVYKSKGHMLEIALGQEGRINRIQMGTTPDHEGVTFIRIFTTNGGDYQAGQITETSNFVDCTPPQGCSALKGFYGSASTIVDRLGCLWG